ncbi:GDSL-like Lipase/Acylhydrolase family protein [Maribacter dokdonensis]|uniref:GDSL-like Lipase/Acylhydrolase family protein n=1 Tax=Maribacter dokdonensis TaxID=320912 RepID=A0ABY0UTG8_9FLAO|nr:SGNH/GDSL hydrolase family protein [Maribacter dokdonensis]SDT16207.1 GDSL-like Lipase/Acylhydrolase family protein [Maribacter dokdonensis]
MKKVIFLVAILCSAMAMAQSETTVEIGRVGDVNLVRFVTNKGTDESYARQNIRPEQVNNGRILFVDAESNRPIISNKGFDLSEVTLSATDPLFATIGATFTDYDDFYTTYGVLVLGKTKPSAGGEVNYPNKGNVSFTMSVGTNEAPAAPYDYIVESHLVADGKEADAALTGGAWKYSGDNSEIRFIANQNSLVAGNIGDAQNSIYWESAFKVSGVFAIRFSGGDNQNEYYTLEIDGEDYPITNPDNVNPGRRWLTIDAGAGVHFVKLKGSFNVQWRGYRTEIGAIAEPWEYDKYSLFFGDSFTAGIGADYTINGYYNFVNDSETHRLIASGTGGAGYVNIGSFKALKDRIIEDYNLFLTDNGVPDEVVIAMGVNDVGLTGIEQGANDAFDNLRTVYSGKVYVIGPWNVNAPSTIAAYDIAKQNVIDAVEGRSGFYFIDVAGVSYTKSDSTHPDTEGHKTLGEYLKKYLSL